MRPSISYLTSTTRIAPRVAAATGARKIELLGLHRRERAIYFLERVADPVREPDILPELRVMFLDDTGAGRLAPALGWYLASDGEVAARFDERLRVLRQELSPLEPLDPDGWVLTTRVVQHHALPVDGQRAIRSFALSLQVDPIIEPLMARDGSRLGRTAVTAFLQPRATLDAVWAVPGEPLAVARVAYVGVPSDTGHHKHTALLARRCLH